MKLSLSRIKLFRISLLFILLDMGLCQSRAIRDTINLQPEMQSYTLRKSPVVEHSEQLFLDGQWFTRYRLDAVHGVLFLDSIPEQAQQLIIYYKWADVPVRIGPYYSYLPLITDSLPAKKAVPEPINNKGASQLVSSGTFYRNIGFSPVSGSDFSGGLQFQLQGQLSENLFINGILTDQDIPIQPEGNTQSLEEIDKVLITVTAPNYTMEAGDLDFRMASGRFLSLQRKITGLGYKYKKESWSARGMVGGNEGTYNALLIKGQDGRQGPYFLTSREGNRDVVILAGTEKIYLNGALLRRGENLDYIIDYSRGEITFNPAHLIHFDSEIYMEYQYSDFAYTKNSNGAQVQYDDGQNRFGVGWFKEKDVFFRSQSQYPGWAIDSLKDSGDHPFLIHEAVPDSAGSYILENGIYVYSPGVPDVPHYTVSFYSDNQNGVYGKRVSASGQLYFEFIPAETRDENSDLYSPGRLLQAPQSENLIQITGTSTLGRFVTIESELAASQYDKNTLSNRDESDNNGIGFNTRIRGDHIPAFPGWKAGYSLEYLRQDSTFHILSLDRDVYYQRTWNTYDIQGDEQLIDFNLRLYNDQSATAEVGKSTYLMNNRRRDRIYTKTEFFSKWVPEFRFQNNRVNNDNVLFQQQFMTMKIFPGPVHPVFTYAAEDDQNTVGYQWITGGLDFQTGKTNGTLSLGRREDYRNVQPDRKDSQSTGIFQELNINRKTPNGWSGFIKLRKRNLEFVDRTKQDVRVTLGQVNARYADKNSPVRFDVNIRSERTFAEQKVIVYDSVGTGFGQYRYDPIYNEYIPDPNGAYIAQTAFIGQRSSVKDGEALFRLRLTGRKTKVSALIPFETVIELKSQYTGSLPYTVSRLYPRFSEASQISRNRSIQKLDLYYRSIKRLRNGKFKILNHRDLIGTDPRGADMKISREYFVQWTEPLVAEWQMEASGTRHRNQTHSTVSTLRERTVDGWWYSLGPVWSATTGQNFKVLFSSGQDNGKRAQGNFQVQFYSLDMDYIYFFKKKTRLQFNARYTTADLRQGTGILPPEANRGQPVGTSLRFQGSIESRVTEKLTLNVNVALIDNARYDQFITMNGELRAYF